MARNHRRKLAPAELTITLPLVGDGSTQNLYCDIAQNLCLLNRKFFGQGYEYVIESVELSSPDSTSVIINRISRSWPVVNAWTKGFSLWREQQNDALRDAGLEDTKGRYNDFKVAMDVDHNSANNLLSNNIISLAGAQAISPTVGYEWSMSDIVVPNDGVTGNTVVYPLHWVGSDSPAPGGSKSLVLAYAQSRARPMHTDPNIVDVPMGGLFGEMQDVGDDDEDIIDLAQQEGNQAPYYNDIYPSAFEFYPGGSGSDGGSNGGMGKTHEYFLSTAATGRFISSYGGSAIIPAGLLQIVHSIADGDSAILRIKIAPGEFKGAMARRIQDVN